MPESKEVRKHRRQLVNSCEFREPADIDLYLQAISYLRQHPSPKVLDTLLLSIRDYDGGEVQFELIEACEAYPNEEYVPALVKRAVKLRRLAPHWATLLFQSVLNTPAAYRVLLSVFVNAKSTEQRAILDWTTAIADGSPKYLRAVKQLQRKVEPKW